MQDIQEKLSLHAPIVKSINTILPYTTSGAQQALKSVLFQVEALMISGFVLEHDYKLAKKIIKNCLMQFKTQLGINTTSVLKKEMIANEIKFLNENIKEFLKICDNKYLRKNQKTTKVEL